MLINGAEFWLATRKSSRDGWWDVCEGPYCPSTVHPNHAASVSLLGDHQNWSHYKRMGRDRIFIFFSWCMFTWCVCVCICVWEQVCAGVCALRPGRAQG